MDKTIQAFCDWLSQTPTSMTIQNVAWIIPMVQSVHIVCITIVMGSALMMDMKLLGVVGRGQTIAQMNRRFLPWVWTALVVLLLSGTILTIAEPGRELMNDVFRIKMLLVVLVALLTAVHQQIVQRHADAWGEAPARPGPARIFAIVSLAIWISIAMCGRWIAYVPHE